MEEQATALLATLKRSSASADAKAQAFNTLKASIKHQRVPDGAQATVFDCIRVAIASQQSPTLVIIGFSTLGHLIKRLSIQDQGHVVSAQSPKLLPILLERLGDAREANRSAAVATLVDLWPLSKEKVETLVRDGAMAGHNARAKEASFKWIAKMHKVEGFHFRSFVPHLVAGLEDADGVVRETAKAAVVELFKNAPERARSDLKKQMAANNVRKATVQYIEAELGGRGAPTPAPDLKASTMSLPAFRAESSTLNDSTFGESVVDEQPPPAEPKIMDPLYFHSEREMNDAFRDMLGFFEGRESEHNWIPRDKSVTKIRRMAQGNGPTDYHVAFLMGVKSMQDGINKVANSLRTTMSTNGCECVQELARTLGPSFDAMADIFLQGFLKMSGATKHIAQENGKTTFDTIIANVSYHKRLMELVWSAFQEKNVAIRQSATTWLKTLLRRNVPKSHFEGSVDLVEKCLKKGLADANPNVKNSTREVFWVYVRSWPAKAEPFRDSLEPRTQKFVDQDPSNPNASLASSQSSASTKAGDRPLTAQSGRASIRETIMAQRKAQAAAAAKIDRPSSAQSVLSPAAQVPLKPRLAQSTRQASNLSTVSGKSSTSSATGSTPGGGLMSAPLRRPRRPELARPATADPYASRNKAAHSGQQTTPSESPVGSPGRGSTVKKSPAKPTRTPASHIPVSPPRAKSRIEQLSQSTRKRLPMHETPAKGDATPTKTDDLTFVVPFTAPPNDDDDHGALPLRKRAGMDKTMSVDSGIAGFAAQPTVDVEENFTMVLPPSMQLAPHHAPTTATTSHIPTPKGSPLRASGTSPRASPRSTTTEHGSPSKAAAARVPRSPLPQRQLFQEETTEQNKDNHVKVYEDPFVASAESPSTPRAASPEKPVLEELPLSDQNAGPIDRNDGSASVRSTASNEQNRPVMQSPLRSPIKANGNGVEVTHDRAETLRSRKLLSSGIERVRARTLDAHGFRRLQDLIKQNNADIWSTESGTPTDARSSPRKERSRFDDLLLALSSYLSTPLDTAKFPASKAQNLKTQALATVRGMLTLWPRQAEQYTPHVLCAVLEARGEWDASSHLGSELERTTGEIATGVAKAGHAGDAMDAVLALIEDDEDAQGLADADVVAARAHTRIVSAALASLASLLALSGSDGAGTSMPEQQAGRLGTVAVRFLGNTDPDVRRADMQFCLELHDRLGGGKVGDSVFWKSMQAAGLKGEQVNLITYYLARRARA